MHVVCIYLSTGVCTRTWKTGQSGQPGGQQAVAIPSPLPASAEVTDVFGCIQLLTWARGTQYRSSCLVSKNSSYTSNRLPSPKIACPYWKNLCLPVWWLPVFTVLGSLRQKKMVDSRLAWATRDAISKEKTKIFKNEKCFSCVHTVCFIETIMV